MATNSCPSVSTVLETLLDAWQEQLADTVYANKLDPVLELRAEVEALRAADLPMGLGRD
jgi:hypothetical protein